MTRIVVTRTGGFAGIARTTEVTDADAVERILGTLRGQPAAAAPAPPRPDGFVYDFTVEGEAAAAETYTVPESALPPAVRALLG
ncbi:MAG TPA: protealysin inhibitor emfourin [Amnibacterium sp.]|uniref:protealysin inhibitor emfourin n=1 Tax=Amnibacterium sp. TaxID=1872496 RepID=UPI002F91C863